MAQLQILTPHFSKLRAIRTLELEQLEPAWATPGKIYEVCKVLKDIIDNCLHFRPILLAKTYKKKLSQEIHLLQHVYHTLTSLH